MFQPFTPDPALFPFESRWFNSDVGQVHYIDEGTGPPILMLHGNPTWSFLYRGIVIRLKKHFRCIAVDYPGFGLSPHPPSYRYTAAEHAEVVGQLVGELGLSDLTIMGQDWGGPIGMRVALDDPSRLRALVMGNTWYWPATTLQMQAFSKIMSSGFVQAKIFSKNLFVERMIPLGVKHKLAPEVMDHYRGPLSTMDSRAGVAEFPREIMNADRWLREIEANVAFELGHLPLLLTWGMHDLAFTPGFMKRFKADFGSVSTVRLDARHYIQEDAPGDIAVAIKAFLGA